MPTGNATIDKGCGLRNYSLWRCSLSLGAWSLALVVAGSSPALRTLALRETVTLPMSGFRISARRKLWRWRDKLNLKEPVL
ncbi:hypothetical protein E2562_024775 [Oryza meyeriana var. granulata]|uniref:Uncharacterized protein n=1 Tax=Oryza meyeriana var. granulata TaxID=110450 RepID=A0A6G1E1Z3_9ORYZ|nr:hypothetical protein E2562_024775 [Oryza meyeriana var. granulata]